MTELNQIVGQGSGFGVAESRIAPAQQDGRLLAYNFVWVDNAGDEIDLTGSSITGKYRLRDDDTASVNLVSGVLAPDADQTNNTGQFTWVLGASDVGTPGVYDLWLTRTVGGIDGHTELATWEVQEIPSNGDVPANTVVTITSDNIRQWSGPFTMGVSRIDSASFISGWIKQNDGGREEILIEHNSQGTITVDLKKGNVQCFEITNNTTFVFPSLVAGVALSFTMEIVSDGSSTITWPATSVLKFSGNTSPTLSTTNGDMDVLVFYSSPSLGIWVGSLSFSVPA